MKKIIIFIVLKIIEVSLIVFYPYLVGCAINVFLAELEDDLFLIWGCGLIFGFVIPVTVVILGFLLIGLAGANWELTKCIHKKLFERNQK